MLLAVAVPRLTIFFMNSLISSNFYNLYLMFLMSLLHNFFKKIIFHLVYLCLLNTYTVNKTFVKPSTNTLLFPSHIKL